MGATYHFSWKREIGLNRTWNLEHLMLGVELDKNSSYLAIGKVNGVYIVPPKIRMRCRPIRQLESAARNQENIFQDLLKTNLPFRLFITMNVFKDVNGIDVSLFLECLPQGECVGLEGDVYNIHSYRLPVPPPGNQLLLLLLLLLLSLSWPSRIGRRGSSGMGRGICSRCQSPPTLGAP